MASFLEELWNSIFTPGPTPTLLVATNAAFAALQLLLLALLIATYSLHFLVLSALCGGLWYSINWFAAEIAKEQKAQKDAEQKKEKSPEPENASDTETESAVATGLSTAMKPPPTIPSPRPPIEKPKDAGPAPTLLPPKSSDTSEAVRRRRSLGESSGYISTDSEWEKVSEGEEKSKRER